MPERGVHQLPMCGRSDVRRAAVGQLARNEVSHLPMFSELVLTKALSVTCDTLADAATRIANTGAPGGISG